MRFKKFMAYSCMMALIMSTVTGCGDENTSKETAAESKIVQVTEIDGDQITATVGEWEENEGQSKEQGDGEQQLDGTPPADADQNGAGGQPDGTPPADADQNGAGGQPDGTPPADGNGDSQSSDEQQTADSTASADENTDSQNADGQSSAGEQPDGTPPADGGQNSQGGPGGSFTAGDESITFTITDDTEIVMEQGEETKSAAASDIKEDTVLEVTLDDDNQATKIVIKGGMGGRGNGGEAGSESGSEEEDASSEQADS